MNHHTLTEDLAIFHGYNENPFLFRKRSFKLNLWLAWQRTKLRIKSRFIR